MVTEIILGKLYIKIMHFMGISKHFYDKRNNIREVLVNFKNVVCLVRKLKRVWTVNIETQAVGKEGFFLF